MSSKPALSTLTAAIDTLLALPATGQLLHLNSNTCERAYEAYIFSLCCDAVRRAGGSVTLTGVLSGPRPSPIVFRGAPGSMASRNQNFAFADCTLNRKQFEVHIDVEYEGTSGALHEIDVSVCDQVHATAVRTRNATPKTSGDKLFLAFECKFYEATPGVSLGRTFVGLVDDCGSLRLRGFVSNLPSDRLSQYFSKASRPEPFLGISPLDPDSEDRFVRNVEQTLRKWA